MVSLLAGGKGRDFGIISADSVRLTAVLITDNQSAKRLKSKDCARVAARSKHMCLNCCVKRHEEKATAEHVFESRRPNVIAVLVTVFMRQCDRLD